LLQKDKECFKSKLEPNGQITVNIVLYGGTVLYGRTPSFQTDRTCTVLYGVLRYGTVITVKKAEVRHISTGKSSNIRSYTVYIYGTGQPYLYGFCVN